MSTDKQFIVTNEGYQRLLQEYENLKKQFEANELEMSSSFQNAAGDGAHDNGEFESLQTKEKMLAGQINYLASRIKSAKIIEVPELSENQVNVNDTVLLRLFYDIDDIEEDTYTLVGGDGNSLSNKISLNSPLGQAIFQRNVGEKVPYKVNDNEYRVEIVEKVLSLKK